MRTAIACAALALFTLSACGPAAEIEQRDPRCDYQDDREWENVHALQDVLECWRRVQPGACVGFDCPMKCGGAYQVHEDQLDHELAVIDVVTHDRYTLDVSCSTSSGGEESFSCSGGGRILISADSCTSETTMILSHPGEAPQGVASILWQVPAE